jgi:predicted ATPase/class 3 adenylate cyclase
MNCSGCGFQIERDFAFCPRCGTRQPKACPLCNYRCEPDFAFCPKCGASVDGSPVNGHGAPLPREGPDALASLSQVREPEAARTPTAPSSHSFTVADRRTVTVLFADLSSFTALSERLDPEVVRGLQNELFAELTAVVQQYGGFVDKFIGDALLALFGAPVAHEDDPERALRAALDMVRKAAAVGERSDACTDWPLALHIGINTGQVVTGEFGAGDAKSYSVTGDTVNTAQRLQSVAAPGEVLVGPLTYCLTRHAFSYQSLGEIALRGKSGKVLVHRLEGPLEAPRAARGLEALGLSAPLIGRDAELAHMIGCLERTCGGSAQLLRLVGEAGIGKSRLTNEFLARVREDARFADVAIRRVTCSPLGGQSYGTLGALVRSAAGIARQATPAEMRTQLLELLRELHVPTDEADGMMPLFFYILGHGDSDGVLRHVEPEQLRRQIFYATRTIFERRLELAPLLVIVEDLHWADAASLEALRFVTDRLERARLMLVFTHRPTPQTDHLDSSRITHTALRLAPLTAADGHQLLNSYFGSDWSGTSNDLSSRILERASGNPLFLEEVVRSLIETGVLVRDGTHWRVTSEDAAAEIPANIHAMLLGRMDRLPQEVRRLAQEAAVIGPRFDANLLKAVVTDPTKIEAGLDLLCDYDLIEELPGAKSFSSQSYRFTQTLLHDVIYQNLLLKQRTEMHGRVGAVLEGLYGHDPDQLEDLTLLGHHFSLAQEKQKGARYLMAAGDRARAVYANDDAIRLYQQALAALTTAGDGAPQRLQLCERIADLCEPAGKRDIAQDHYRMVLAACRACGDRVGEARILRKFGRLLWDAGKRAQAQTHYAQAAALLEGTAAPIEHALLLQERGRLAFRTGDHEAAVKWADEALAQAGSVAGAETEGELATEAARAIAEARNTKGVALARLGRTREAVREVEKSVAVAEQAGLMSAACRGYANLGTLYTVVDPAKAIGVCRRGLEVAQRISDLGFQARLLANLAVACCTFTDRCAEEGVPAAEKAIELDRALDQREHLSVPLIVLGQIHQCHGKPELAARCYNEALEVAKETGEPQLLFPCYDGLATLSLDLDALGEAERYFGLAQEVCERHGLDPEALVVLPYLD